MFFVTESVPSLASVRELCDWEIFSKEQKWIIYQIVEEKKTWKQISTEFNAITGQQLGQGAIRTCLVRSSLSQQWAKGQCFGSDPYLCSEDQKALNKEITERAEITKALNTVTILDEALKLKSARMTKACQLLKLLRCYALSSALDDTEINSPTRTWVNEICKQIEEKIASVTYIDRNRFKSCSFSIIDTFFNLFANIIRNTPPELRFTVDETMMEKTTSNKVIIPDSMKQYIEPAPPEMPHITAMCATSVFAMKPPLFIILSGLKHIPDELNIYVNTGKIWLVSTPSGWMNRFAFALWAFHFAIWYNTSKDAMQSSFIHKWGLIVLDGHTSRENPLALEILRDAGINVLVLPSHTTHVMQMFDVGLAGALKNRFTQHFNANCKDKHFYVPNNNAASMRRIAVDAFIQAWDDIANYSNCVSSAASVGLEPVDRTRPKSNPYVRDLTEQEQVMYEQNRRRRENMLNINNCLITTNEKIEEIRTFIARCDKDKALCKKKSEFANYYELYNYLTQKAEENGVYMLSKPPPYKGMYFYDR